jgi:hypothetical protein
MPSVKNIDKGPRGLWAGKKPNLQLVMIEAGQTRDDLDISPDELKSAHESGYFEIAGKLSDAAKQTADNVAKEAPVAAEGVKVEKTYTPERIEELRDEAKSIGLKPRANWTGEKLETAIAEKKAAS